MDGPLEWYQNPLFNRYWHHYQATLGWFQRHKRVLDELEHGIERSCESVDNRKRRRSAAEPASPSYDDERDYEDEPDGPDEELEMEVTEEMIAFFEQSERHRRELMTKKVSRQESYLRRSLLAFCQQRFRVLGPSAAMIHGMETAMQLSCDRFVDMKQPKHWPNIPLKL
ncbi:unnamed protein product [Ixodes hexagonus]